MSSLLAEERLLRLNWNLLVAAANGDAAAVQAAVSDGANVNCVERYAHAGISRVTPLMKACQGGYDDIIRILLDAGADARWKDFWGLSAISDACSRGRLSTAQLLINHDNGLLEMADSEGWTPLFGAICSKNVDLVRFLIHRGANVHAIADRNSKGSSTLIEACRMDEIAGLYILYILVLVLILSLPIGKQSYGKD